MKLLFDQNLSFKLCRRLGDLFPDSNQVRLLGLDQATDAAIWDYAKTNDFILVTLDSPGSTAAKAVTGSSCIGSFPASC
jgi:predicted nuclease of predicted toxin-antitoxin system